MKIAVISLFPEMFESLEFSIPGRAQLRGLLELNFYNPRDFTNNPNRTVDDRPFGGGPGMVMMVEPLQKAIAEARKSIPTPAPVILLSPQGKVLKQQHVAELSQLPSLILVSGRYEGIDQRLIDTEIDEEWSIGDYVLSGGELPAMVLIDAITRLLPGALGDSESAVQDSFTAGILDCPHYTRPQELAGMAVPDVLLRGDHKAICQWRLKQALGQTWLKRPDLLSTKSLTAEEEKLLAEFKAERG